MTTTHIEQVPDDRAALAPYNFVPLPEAIVPAERPLPTHDAYHTDRLTGRIECLLTTSSPLYVRSGLTPEQFAAFGEKSFDELTAEQKRIRAQFFSLEDATRPVIPGSSLRGMLRALVEVAGYGKVERVTDQGLVYRAVGDTTSLGMRYRERLMQEDRPRYYTPLMRAGYIERSGTQWQIRPAQEVNGVSFTRIFADDVRTQLPRWKGCRNASAIWVMPGPYEYQRVREGFLHIRFSQVRRWSSTEEPGFVRGVMVRSGRMPKKVREAVVFDKDTAAEPIQIPEWMVLAYREQISKEQQALLGDNGVLQQDQPVFYLVENGELVFFGHAMMFRLPFRLSPLDFVPEHLRRDEDIDLAEAIFGYVRRAKQGRQQEQALAGRVFVGDATLVPGQGEVFERPEPITPHILGGPKPTTFQHYLAQTGTDRDSLRHYASGQDQTAIRGHKLYWHQGADPVVAMTPAEQLEASQTQLTQLRPVRAGVQFSFTLRFENLSRVELGALLWVLRKASDNRFRLKLGMAKPLGMGAVAIAPTVHVGRRADRYRSLLSADGTWQIAESEMVLQDRDACIAAFERHVLDSLKAQDPGGRDYTKITSIEQLTRIKCLLTMLVWPGPGAAQTRYMEIERDIRQHPIGRVRPGDRTVNEYKERPVLPTPLQVYPDVLSARRQQTTPMAAVLPVIGDVFVGKVLGVDETVVTVEIAGFDEEQAIGVLKADALGGKTSNYRPGNPARVEVTNVRTLKSGRTIVELKPGPKKR